MASLAGVVVVVVVFDAPEVVEVLDVVGSEVLLAGALVVVVRGELVVVVVPPVVVVLFVVEPPIAEPALAGGGVPSAGFWRAPVPHGMGALVVGWVGLAAGVVSPFGPAKVKRVVQVVFGAKGEVNW